MTQFNRVTFGPGFKDFDKFFIGYDDLFDRLNGIAEAVHKNQSNYPPYNIYKITEDNYAIEMAVAGFGDDEIDIELQENRLTVAGTKKADITVEFIHQGLSGRDFTRTFGLAEDVVVKGAELKNGLLTIALERVIPEHKLPKKIAIGTIPEIKVSNKELLTENKE